MEKKTIIALSDLELALVKLRDVATVNEYNRFLNAYEHISQKLQQKDESD